MKRSGELVAIGEEGRESGPIGGAQGSEGGGQIGGVLGGNGSVGFDLSLFIAQDEGLVEFAGFGCSGDVAVTFGAGIGLGALIGWLTARTCCKN